MDIVGSHLRHPETAVPSRSAHNPAAAFARHRAVCRVLLCSLLLTTGCGEKTENRSIARAQTLYDKGDLEPAAAAARTITKDSSSWPEAQYLLGRIETALHGPEVALPYFELVPRDGSPVSLKSIASAAELEYQSCRLSASARHSEELIEQSPNEAVLQSRFAHLLVATGQRSRAEPYVFEIVKSGKIPLREMVWFSAPERPHDADPLVQSCSRNGSSDALVQLGIAAEEMRSQKYAAAKVRIAQTVRDEPGLADAQAMLGELSLDGGLRELESWHAALPAKIQNHSEIWYVRGLWARRVNQSRVAARCFWETIRQIPTHQRAMYQLGQLVTQIDPSRGAAFSERAQKQKELGDAIEQVLIQQGRDREQFKHIVSLLVEMGRDWEAWSWATLACDLGGKSGVQLELLNSLSHVPEENPPRTRPEYDLAALFDLSDWPGFDTLQSAESGRDRETQPSVSRRPPVPVRFDDQAAELGVDFTYFQSHSADSRKVRMFESTGGGVGVIDFDLDGWSDLFLTQGVEWKMGAERPSPSGRFHDRLYRNRGDRFEDVTIVGCPLDENGYGQGCSAGDFDNDGFPDLYVANIGANQLLRNNGDGTFSDVSRSASITGEAWTTSCLIADLNADGNPDLFDVNYLQGDRLFSIECGANRCSVKGYQGAPDQVQLSRGDGTFETISNATPHANAKGLGIVLFHVDRERMPSLFIANDQVPNFFLRPTSTDGRYTDESSVRGLAVNMYGSPTASMGVAAGDVNHDGKLDLFVTNFEGEAKNLFLQRDHGFFEDAIFGSGLMAAGIPYVGWGTQFLDADNDGELDLVAANGHIADFHEPNVEYRMPLQFFRGVGQGRFAQPPAADVGPLFERNLFGRSLATVDWNRDGRTDFVVSCIDSPAVLATSRCPDQGHWLDVRLHARSSARDAIGAVVEAHSGSAVSSRQLVAGDGYQASNQRTLHFGLGTAGSVDRLVVRWPSGATSVYRRLSVDMTVELIEGAPLAVEQSREFID